MLPDPVPPSAEEITGTFPAITDPARLNATQDGQANGPGPGWTSASQQ
jgi:hypothetical protein